MTGWRIAQFAGISALPRLPALRELMPMAIPDAG
jgi:hypothetical protein